ncbi:hypothetical protein BD414DRAFT_239824 [Trametes punicea]|nr:hypothetical protein BD414DRAFT_239824 [Trametes punicea]
MVIVIPLILLASAPCLQRSRQHQRIDGVINREVCELQVACVLDDTHPKCQPPLWHTITEVQRTGSTSVPRLCSLRNVHISISSNNCSDRISLKKSQNPSRDFLQALLRLASSLSSSSSLS